MLPNFLIVGAAKCGSTALYYYLNQHPEISFPTLKEPKFLTAHAQSFPHLGIGDKSVDKFTIKTHPEYEKLYLKIQNKKVGDASADTLYFYQQSIPKIKQTLGDIPILIVLRNPTKRAFSAYQYLKRDSRETLPFDQALGMEEERLTKNFDFVWGYKNGGLYYKQVKAFMENFSKVMVILQEDLAKNPTNTLKNVFQFLEVEENINIDSHVQHNESGIPTNFLTRFLLSRNNPISTFFREGLKIIMPRNWLEKVASNTLEKEKIDAASESILGAYFLDDINNLEILIQKDLSHWK